MMNTALNPYGLQMEIKLVIFQQMIYTLLMLENDFISASANISELDKDAEGMPIILQRQDNANLNAVMSNSFGFGGTNATLVFQRLT